MTPDQHKVIADSVKEAIQVHVNGKIDKLTLLITEHTKTDEETARNLNQYIKDDMLWKEEADPYIKLAANISGTWKFVAGVVVTLLSLIGFYKIVTE